VNGAHERRGTASGCIRASSVPLSDSGLCRRLQMESRDATADCRWFVECRRVIQRSWGCTAGLRARHRTVPKAGQYQRSATAVVIHTYGTLKLPVSALTISCSTHVQPSSILGSPWGYRNRCCLDAAAGGDVAPANTLV
jgi:hypothetical protein